MRAHLAALLLVAAVAVPSVASAWAPLDSCRPVWTTQPSPYHVNQNGYSRIPIATVRSIFAASMDEWARPCCSDWSAREVGLTTGVGQDRSNSQNIFSFAEASWPNELGDPRYTLGVTLTGWSINPRSGGCTDLRADMIFNARNHTFGTAHSVSTVDLQGVTTHEAGHWLGLSHSTVRGATMWDTYTDEGDRSLHADDEAGVCALYPGDCGCTSASDCDSGQDCVGGRCEDRPCASDDDCDTGLECGTRTGSCVVPPCRSDSDCPGSQVCEAGVCVVDADCPTCLPCTAVSDCGGGEWLCAGDGSGAGFCTRTCSSAAECPGNSACFGIEGESFSICLNNDADRVGLCPDTYVCLDDTTPDPCDGVTCGPGETCEDGECLAAGGSDGCIVCDACEETADCPGGDCFSFDGVSTVCATPCSTDADCPPNTTCWGFTSEGTTLNLCLNSDLETAGACPGGFECAAEPIDPCEGVSCPAGQTCDPGTGVCVGGGGSDTGTGSDAGADAGADAAGPDDTGGAGDAGRPVGGECSVCTPCADDSECGGGSTCELVGAVGRFCTMECGVDESVCPGNTTCFDVRIGEEIRALCLNVDAGDVGICDPSFECREVASVEDAGGDSVDPFPDGSDGTPPTYYPGGGVSNGCTSAPGRAGGGVLLVGVLFLFRRRRR